MADLAALKSLVESNNQDGLITFLNKKNVGNVGYDKLCPNFEDYYILKDLLKNGHKDMAMTCINAGFRVFCQVNVRDRSELLIHLAVILGYPDIVQSLLNRKPDLYLKNNTNDTPLILAAICGNDQITNMILSHVNSNNYFNNKDFSHFHVACMQNCVDKVKNFLGFGTDINQSVKKNAFFNPGFTGLHFAVQAHSIETVEFLVRSGADITIKDKRGLTPLHLAFRMRNNQMVNSLLSVHHYFMSNPVDPANLSHFHIACAMNNLDLVKDFVEKQLEVDHIWSHNDAIRLAIQNDCTNIVKYLVSDERLVDWEYASNILDNAYEKGNAEITSLIKSKIEKHIIQAECKGLAVSSKYPRKIKSCLNGNCDAGDICFKRIKLSQFSELHVSVVQNNSKKISSILKNYDHSIILTQDARGKTPLHLAFETYQKNAVLQMLEYHLEFDKNPVDRNGLSHFHIACTIKDYPSVLENFIKKGADINVPVNVDSPVFAGWTSLHFAVASKSFKVLKLLLSKGADYTIKNAAGLSPFDLAIPGSAKFLFANLDDAEHDWKYAKEILLSDRDCKRDNFNNRGVTLLHISCSTGGVDEARRLVSTDILNKVIDGDVEEWGGYSPLHIAAFYGNEEVLRMLLDLNAYVSIQTVQKQTAADLMCDNKPINERLFVGQKNFNNVTDFSQFYLACKSITNISAVQHYLKLGVDVNEPHITDFGGKTTPLHLAVKRNNVEMIKFFLENGADVHARDSNLNTPLHECRSLISLNLLIQYGADVDARNCDFVTALSSTLYWCEDPNWLSALFEHGLDINEQTRFRVPPLKFDRLDMPSLIVAAKHIKRLLVLGVKINKSVMIRFEIAKSNMSFRFNDHEFETLCRVELDHMKMMKIDNCVNLYDLLLKEDYSMAKYSNNETVKQLMQSEMDYPIYSYLLILQFKRGLKRISSLQEAKKSLNILSNSSLFDDEMDCIFQYLNNRQLKYLNQAVKGLD